MILINHWLPMKHKRRHKMVDEWDLFFRALSFVDEFDTVQPCHLLGVATDVVECDLAKKTSTTLTRDAQCMSLDADTAVSLSGGRTAYGGHDRVPLLSAPRYRER